METSRSKGENDSRLLFIWTSFENDDATPSRGRGSFRQERSSRNLDDPPRARLKRHPTRACAHFALDKRRRFCASAQIAAARNTQPAVFSCQEFPDAHPLPEGVRLRLDDGDLRVCGPSTPPRA